MKLFMALNHIHSIAKGSKTIQSNQKLKGAFKESGCARTCTEQQRTIRAYEHDARLLAQKPTHLLNDAFIEIGQPLNH
jgi:hypothetical protein